MPLVWKIPEPYTVTIDHEPIRLHLKRMGVEEFEVFNARFRALGKGRGEPRSADTATTAAEHRALRAEEIAHLEDNAAWVAESFDRYVSVEPGDFLYGDEVVTNGRRFLELMVGNPEIGSDVLGELWLMHTLTDAQKKTLRSRSASATGSSTALPSAASGVTPETAAASVAPPDSATPAAAAPSSDPLSGTTDPSSSALVLSSS